MSSILKRYFKKQQKKEINDLIKSTNSDTEKLEKTLNHEILEKKEKILKLKRFNKINEKRKNKNINKDNNQINYRNLNDLKLNEIDYINKIFKSDLKYNLDSKLLIKDIKNKKKISINSVKIINVISDGNCYFRTLSEFLYGNSENHILLRKAIASFCDDNR